AATSPVSRMLMHLRPILLPADGCMSPRWWILLAVCLVFARIAFVSNGFMPGPVSSTYPALINPLGIAGSREFLTNLNDLSAPFGLFAILGMLTSVVVRYRRGDSLQRRQLRGFFLAMVIAVVPFAVYGLHDGLSSLL